MDNGRYNGYANHATWKVNLEYFSDYVQNLDDEECKKLAATKTMEELRAMMEQMDEWSEAMSEAMKAHTALQDSLKENIDTYVKEGTDDEIVAGLAFSFLNEVNWVEIADKIITDARDRLKG